jgi:hypothetical protein
VVVGYFKVLTKNLRGDKDGLQYGVHVFPEPALCDFTCIIYARLLQIRIHFRAHTAGSSSVAEVTNGTQFRFLTVTNMYNLLLRSYSYYIGLEIIFLPILIK